MVNGTRVVWTSLTDKKRFGRYVCDFHSNKLSMVIGEWDGKVHRIHKSRLEEARTQKENSDG